MNKKKKTSKNKNFLLRKNERGILNIGCVCSVLLLTVAIVGAFLIVVVGKRFAEEKKPKEGETPSTGPVADCGEIPGKFISIYKVAAGKYPMPWQLLPAVHKNETGFSTNEVTYNRINDAGCCAGPMQMNVVDVTWNGYKDSSAGQDHNSFADHHHIPSSDWHAHDLDGYGDGNTPPSPYDDVDAIFAAAHMLSGNGAETFQNDGIRAAIKQYNFSDDYVNDVFTAYQSYKGSCQ